METSYSSYDKPETSSALSAEASEIREQLRPKQDAKPSIRAKKSVATTDDFTGTSVPAQFKLPQDLVASLKLHSISTGESMSAIVLRCLTSQDVIAKAWVSTRKAG